MVRPQALDRSREAYARRQWRVAYEQLSAAAGEGELGLDDLERLATAAYLIANDGEAIATWKRLHQAHVERDNVERAVRFGFWLGLALLLRGEAGQSAGWIARSQRLLEDRPVDCVEHGYVLVVPALRAMGGGDARGACATFERVVALGSRHGDPDLLAVGLLGRGQALIQCDESDAGVASLDEALVGVTAGEVSPILAGILYCAAILTCQRVFDLRRAKEWTAALADWCTAQPELVPFRGECLVHRAEIMHMQGEWDQALREAEHACAQLVDGLRIKGRALYVMGEIHRLRGDLERAEALYAEAGRHGYEPQPGVSRLRVAQGQIDAASATMRRVLTESGNLQGPRAGASRPGVLGPFVEIMLAVDLEGGRPAGDTTRWPAW